MDRKKEDVKKSQNTQTLSLHEIHGNIFKQCEMQNPYLGIKIAQNYSVEELHLRNV